VHGPRPLDRPCLHSVSPNRPPEYVPQQRFVYGRPSGLHAVFFSRAVFLHQGTAPRDIGLYRLLLCCSRRLYWKCEWERRSWVELRVLLPCAMIWVPVLILFRRVQSWSINYGIYGLALKLSIETRDEPPMR
jgi:hypothetical protein